LSFWQKIKLGVTALCFMFSSGVSAQEFSALARLDVEQSGVDDLFRQVEVVLYLSQSVPFRVFTLDDPKRLVMDFREVDFSGVNEAAYARSNWILSARFGTLRPGWSRMILDLSDPVRVAQAGMTVNIVDGTAKIEVVLRETSQADFVSAVGAPNDPDWVFKMALDPAPVVLQEADGPLIIVIDPGHGGLDPGAEYADTEEADIMLALALELAAALGRIEGIQPAVTRSEDTFLALQERLTLARGAKADLFISLHADALEGVQATGASVYTLTDIAALGASQRMAERHERGDLLAGVDLRGHGDEVAMVLQDLLRVETAAAGNRFAAQLVQAMRDTGAVLNSRPRRQAALAVLHAADFPSVLFEVGFLSNKVDRARLTSPQGRAPIVAAVTLAVGRWAVEEAALAPLLRQ
jgi:N-acetylmuramoyl-L-alanine amidase